MIKIYDEITPELKEKWIELEQHANLFPFQKLEWIEKYILTVGNKNNKYIFYCIFCENEIQAIFPFSIINFNLIKILCFIGLKFSDYCYAIIKNGYDIKKINLDEIFKKLNNKYKFDCIIIKNQKKKIFNKENIFFNYFDEKERYKETVSYQINIKSNWKNFVSKNKNKKIKRLENLIKKNLESSLQYKINTFDLNLDEKTKIINFLINKKRDQLNRTKIFHYLNNSKYENFLKELFIENSDKMVAYSYLKSNEDLIAVHIGFLYKKKFYYLFPVYDYKFKKLSAGKYLLIKIIQNCFENNYELFDFTTGGESYKKEWSNNEEILYSFVKNTTILGNLFKKFYFLYKSF